MVNQVPFLASDELLILVNEHRSDQELVPLKRNELLDEIAKNISSNTLENVKGLIIQVLS